MKIVAGEGKKKREILSGPAEGCPPEGCPADNLGWRVRGLGFSSGFWGQKQKQNKNKMKSEMNEDKKK